MNTPFVRFYFMFILRFAVPFFALVFACTFAYAKTKTPPLMDSPAQMGTLQKVKAVAAKAALENGLPKLAQNICEKLLEDQALADNAEIKLVLMDSLLGQDKSDAAEKLMADFDGDTTGKMYLRRAVLALYKNRLDLAQNFLSKCNVATLSPNEASWYFLCRGLSSKLSGKLNEAKSFFETAKKNSSNDIVITAAQANIYECEIQLAKDPEELKVIAASLRDKINLNKNIEDGFLLAKEYAITLFALGKKDQAKAVLQEQLDIPLVPEIVYDDFSLLLAIMDSDAPDAKRARLSALISKTKSVSDMETALLLLKNSLTDKAALLKELLLILEKPNCPLKDRIMLECAHINLDLGNTSKAVELANELLTSYPASIYAENALGVLAWSAFSSENETPQYAQAGKYLEKMAAMTKNEKKAAEIKLMAADCLYLEGDYEIARISYQNLYKNKNLERFKGTMLNRLVDCLIKTGKVDEAYRLIYNAIAERKISADDIWAAQWNLINAYKKDGRYGDALNMLEHFIKASMANTDGILQIRMLWAKAMLCFENAKKNECISLCDEILQKAENLPDEYMSLKILISSNTMLLKGKALSLDGKISGENGAYAVLENLRHVFPKTKAALASYISEANIFAKEGNYLKAASLCEELFNTNPDSEYAPYALYQAAQYYVKTQAESSYKNALLLLDKLCEKFPENPLAFHARIFQCETMRLLNAFNEAKNLYLDIINKYANNPEIDTAKLGLGDTYLAQPNKEGEAAIYYEKLWATPSAKTEIRAEAAFKLGFALDRIGRKKEAREVWWIAANELLNSGESNGKADYWIGRSLLYLARSFDADKSPAQARKVYDLLIEKNLPGSGEAKIRLKRTN